MTYTPSGAVASGSGGGYGGFDEADYWTDVSNRAKVLQNNPIFAQDPNALMQMATSSYSTYDLLKQSTSIYASSNVDRLATNLSKMSAESQRVVWGNLRDDQQAALVELGYQAPDTGSGVHHGFTPLGFLGSTVGKGMRIANTALHAPGIKQGLDALMFIGDQPAHLYRTLRLMEDNGGWQAAIGAAAGLAVGIALTPATGGASLAMTAGLIGGGALLGASAGAALVHPNDWRNAFMASTHGERVFTRGAQQRANELLESPRLAALAKEIAWNGDLAGLAKSLASHRDADRPNVLMQSLTEYADDIVDAADPNHDAIVSHLADLVRAPEFMEAVRTLQQGKISFGRDIARGVGLHPGDSWYGKVSGALDAAWVLTLDPTLALGKAFQWNRARRLAVPIVSEIGENGVRHIADVATVVEGIRVKAANNVRIGAALDEVAAAVDTRRFDRLRRAVPSAGDMWQPLLDYATKAKKGGLAEFNRESLLGWLEEGEGLSRMLAGQGVKAGHAELMLPTIGFSAFGKLIHTEKLGDYLKGVIDIADDNRSAAFLKRRLGDNYEAFKAAGDINTIRSKAGASVAEIPEMPELYRRTAAFMGWVDQMPGVNHVVRQLGALGGSLTTMLPNRSMIRFDGFGTAEDMYRLTEMGRIVGMSSEQRRLFLDTIMNAQNGAMRREVATSFLDGMLTTAGLRTNPRASELVDHFINKARQAYGGAAEGMIRTGDNLVPEAILPMHQAFAMPFPDLKELQRAARKGMVLPLISDLTNSQVADIMMNKIWKPAVLLRVGFIPRAAGEELLAFLAREGPSKYLAQFGYRSVAEGQFHDEFFDLARQGATFSGLSQKEITQIGRLRYAAHVRPIERMMNYLHWQEPWIAKLDEYSTWMRRQLTQGLAPEAVEKIPVRWRTALAGKPESFRRLVLAGADQDTVRHYESFVSKYADSVMHEISSKNASLFGRGFDIDDAIMIDDVDRNGKPTQHLARPDRGSYIVYGPGDPYAARVAHDGHVDHILDDPVHHPVNTRMLANHVPQSMWDMDDEMDAVVATFRSQVDHPIRRIVEEAVEPKSQWEPTMRALRQSHADVAKVIDKAFDVAPTPQQLIALLRTKANPLRLEPEQAQAWIDTLEIFDGLPGDIERSWLRSHARLNSVEPEWPDWMQIQTPHTPPAPEPIVDPGGKVHGPPRPFQNTVWRGVTDLSTVSLMPDGSLMLHPQFQSHWDQGSAVSLATDPVKAISYATQPTAWGAQEMSAASTGMQLEMDGNEMLAAIQRHPLWQPSYGINTVDELGTEIQIAQSGGYGSTLVNEGELPPLLHRVFHDEIAAFIPQPSKAKLDAAFPELADAEFEAVMPFLEGLSLDELHTRLRNAFPDADFSSWDAEDIADFVIGLPKSIVLPPGAWRTMSRTEMLPYAMDRHGDLFGGYDTANDWLGIARDEFPALIDELRALPPGANIPAPLIDRLVATRVRMEDAGADALHPFLSAGIPDLDDAASVYEAVQRSWRGIVDGEQVEVVTAGDGVEWLTDAHGKAVRLLDGGGVDVPSMADSVFGNYPLRGYTPEMASTMEREVRSMIANTQHDLQQAEQWLRDGMTQFAPEHIMPSRPPELDQLDADLSAARVRWEVDGGMRGTALHQEWVDLSDRHGLMTATYDEARRAAAQDWLELNVTNARAFAASYEHELDLLTGSRPSIEDLDQAITDADRMIDATRGISSEENVDALVAHRDFLQERRRALYPETVPAGTIPPQGPPPISTYWPDGAGRPIPVRRTKTREEWDQAHYDMVRAAYDAPENQRVLSGMRNFTTTADGVSPVLNPLQQLGTTSYVPAISPEAAQALIKRLHDDGQWAVRADLSAALTNATGHLSDDERAALEMLGGPIIDDFLDRITDYNEFGWASLVQQLGAADRSGVLPLAVMSFDHAAAAHALSRTMENHLMGEWLPERLPLVSQLHGPADMAHLQAVDVDGVLRPLTTRAGRNAWALNPSQVGPQVDVIEGPLVRRPDGSTVIGTTLESIKDERAKLYVAHFNKTTRAGAGRQLEVTKDGYFRDARALKPIDVGSALPSNATVYTRDGRPVRAHGEQGFLASSSVLDDDAGFVEGLYPVLGDAVDKLVGERRFFGDDRIFPGLTEQEQASRLAKVPLRPAYRSHWTDYEGTTLPSQIFGPRYVPEDQIGVLRQMVNFGFDRIIAPVIDAVVRTPMAAHSFTEAMKVNMALTRWLRNPQLWDRDLPNAFAPVMARAALDVPTAQLAADVRAVAPLLDRSATVGLQTLTSDEAVVRYGYQLFDNPDAIRALEQYAGAADVQRVMAHPWWATPLRGADDPMAELVKMYEKYLPPKVLDRGWEGVQTALPALPSDMRDVMFSDTYSTLNAARRNLAHVTDTAAEYASQRAITNGMQFIDSHEIRSQYGEYAKAFTPFWYAEENFLKRWARTLAIRPDALRRGQLLYGGLKSGGVIRTDANGKDWFVYPGSGLIAEIMGKGPLPDVLPAGVVFAANPASMLPGFDPQTTGIPQASPITAFALHQVTSLFPELKPIEKTLTGGQASNAGALSQFVPVFFRRLYDAVTKDEDTSRRYASAMMTAAQVLEANGHGLPDNATPAQIDDYVRNLRDSTRTILLAQAAVGFVVPGTPQIQFTGDSNMELSHLTGLNVDFNPDTLRAEFRALVQELGIEEGTTQFLKFHPMGGLDGLLATNDGTSADPQHPLAYATSQSTSTSGAPLPATKHSLKYITDNPKIFTAYPEGAAWLIPPDPDAKTNFDHYVYTQETIAGLRKMRTPEEFMTAMKFKEGAIDYFTAKDLFDGKMATLNGDHDQKTRALLTAQWQVYATNFKALHPIFAGELESGRSRERRRNALDQLRLALSDPATPPGEYVDNVRTMLDAFDLYKITLQRFSLSRSAAARRAVSQLKEAYGLWSGNFVGTHQDVEPLWLTLLRPEAALS